MALIFLTLAYFIGLILGQALWGANWVGCAFPAWLWILPLATLPFAPLLNQWQIFRPHPAVPMRWPLSAGFEPPQSGPSPALIFACGLCLLAGTLRYISHPLTPCWTLEDLAYYNLPADRAFDREAPQVTLTGYVSSYPLISDTKQRLHVVIETITPDEGKQHVHGVLRFSTGIRERYRYGQPVRLRGRLVDPPVFEDFSYRDYLSRKGVHSLLYNAKIDQLPGEMQGDWLTQRLYAFRARGEALVNRLIPEPYAGLANGMLLGIEAGIPDDLYEQFNLTGTTHTLVISGSNVALISALMVTFGQRLFGKRRALWPALIGIACYALIVGGDPAVLRAALMGSLYVIASHLGRRSTAIVSLAAACWFMTVLNPLTLWDVGFQLSSAATAGLILFSPTITAAAQNLWPGWQGGFLTDTTTHGDSISIQSMLYGLIQDGLLVTIAANITTLPLVVYYFGRLSIVSFLTNLLISPVQGLIMLWGTMGIIIGVTGLTWLAWLILLIPWLSLVWTVGVVEWTAAIPGGSLDIAGYNFGALLLTYVLIFSLHWRKEIIQRCQAWFQQGFQQLSMQIWGPATLGVISVASILLWAGVASQPDGRLHVYFLDIGQGSGIFIQTPSGRQVLVDGGESPQLLFSELGDVMPFWDRSIDMLILSHPDADHMDAQVEVPRRYDVSTAVHTPVSQGESDSAAWRTAMVESEVDIQLQHAGGWIDLGDGVALWMIWPPKDGLEGEESKNENSLVIKLVYGEFSVLLTGDAGRPSEAEWLESGSELASTVLAVGHHGSSTSTSEAFLQAASPSIAVIQSGEENRFGHPHEEVLEVLDGRVVLRNDIHGRVHIWSDGAVMWLDTEKNMPEF
ncbi:MAG: DNA internalization-related competence protein ComEC/Rec2 [Chloroflexota bacterium]